MEGAPRGGQLHDPPLRNVGHAPVATHRGFAARYMDFLGLELALNASILRWIPAVLAFSLVVHAGAAWLLPARGLAAAMKELGSLIVDELVCGKRDPARQNDLDACFSGWAVKESLNFFTPSAHEAFRVGSVLGEVFGFSCLYGFLLVVCAVLVALALPRGPVLLRVSMKCMYACGTFIVLAPLGGIAFLLIKSEKWAGAVASATTPTFDGANLMFPQFSQGIPVENTTGQLTLNFDDSTSLQGGLESIPLRDLYFQGLDVLHNVTQLGEVLPEVIGTHISEALPSLSQLQNAASATESGACPAEDRDCLSEKLKQKQSGTSTFAGEQCPADGQVCAAPHGKNEFDSKTAIEKSNPSRTQTPGTPANFHIFGSTPESDASAANQTVSLVCMLEDVFVSLLQPARTALDHHRSRLPGFDPNPQSNLGNVSCGPPSLS